MPLEIHVLESGFTAFPNSFRDPAGMATYGLIVANPNPDLSAELFGLRVRLFDATGIRLAEEHLVIWTMLPLAHVAIGNDVLGAGSAAEMTVEVEASTSSWWRPASPETSGAVSFREVTTALLGQDGIRTTGVMDAVVPGAIALQVVALYRDHEGDIIGAAFGDVNLGTAQDIEFVTFSQAEFADAPVTEMFWFPLS